MIDIFPCHWVLNGICQEDIVIMDRSEPRILIAFYKLLSLVLTFSFLTIQVLIPLI